MDTHGVDGVWMLAHPDDPIRSRPVGGKVHVGHLRHGMADALVDRAADFPAHRVRNGNIHVGGGDRSGHGLEAVPD